MTPEAQIQFLKDHPLTDQTLIQTEQGMQTLKDIQAAQTMNPNRHQRRAAMAWMRKNKVRIVRNPHHDPIAPHPTDVREDS